MISTLWSGLTWREALLVGWIQPRGVVAVAVAGLFAAELQAIGRPGGSIFDDRGCKSMDIGSCQSP